MSQVKTPPYFGVRIPAKFFEDPGRVDRLATRIDRDLATQLGGLEPGHDGYGLMHGALGVPGFDSARRVLLKHMWYAPRHAIAQCMLQLYDWLAGTQPASGKASDGRRIVANTALRLSKERNWILGHGIAHRIVLKARELASAHVEASHRSMRQPLAADARIEDVAEDSALQPLDQIVAAEEIELLMRQLVALPDQPIPLQTVIRLHFGIGVSADRHSFPVIDARMGWRPGRAREIAQRAIEILRWSMRHRPTL